MGDLPNRIAIVYDRVNKWGGAERVLLALHEIFPQAPLFTAVYNPATAGWADVFPAVHPSFLQHFPWAKSHHELYPWLAPLAFETFNFRNFDAVISVTSADAKGVLTPPGTFHFCYCLTPTRYLWSHSDYYQSQTAFITKPIFDYLKFWDSIAAHRPDAYCAISNTVQSRISTFYHLPSTVCYPPVDVDIYSQPAPPPSIKDFFLFVSRLVGYKRPQTVINVFNTLNLPLVVVGSGHEEKKLKRSAKPNIIFAGQVSQETLVGYYQNAKAAIFFHEEDFGIVPLEAHAAGTPVIALNAGGASETIIHNKTGLLLDDPSEEALAKAILGFDASHFNPEFIKSYALKFSKQRFQSEFAKIFTSEWKRYKSIYTS